MDLIHLHIPKSAGSTFNYVLKRLYPGRVCEEKSFFNQTVEYQPGKFAGDCKAVFGHFESSLFNAGQETRVVSFLRDPVDRIVSGYYNVLRDARNPVHAEVVKMTLLDYVLSGVMTDNDNGQVRRIAGIYKEVAYGQVTEEHYNRAIEVVNGHDYFIGISELFDESIIRMKEKMNWPQPLYHYIHKGKNKPANLKIEDSALLKIMNHNRFDYQLYQFFLKRMMISMDGAFTRKVNAFRLENRLYNAMITPALIYKKIKMNF